MTTNLTHAMVRPSNPFDSKSKTYLIVKMQLMACIEVCVLQLGDHISLKSGVVD